MFQRWPKRDPNKHYYLVPNEVFNLGLTSHEIAVYNYLLRCEDRRTYQCHPSYRTIGRSVQLSENTVRKYVAGLEEKCRRTHVLYPWLDVSSSICCHLYRRHFGGASWQGRVEETF